MRVKFLATTSILITITTFCFAQYQQNLPKARPIPPNAASMFKVLERPIGTFTGTIPISFPLCSISSGPLSASITLNYNSTGGIKVEEQSSCVGLGFSLADGAGRITQMVRGKPDDMSLGMLTNPYAKPSTFSTSNTSNLAALKDDALDLEPDTYLYNFNGRSGKFFLKETGEIIMMGSNDGINISYYLDTNQAPPGQGIRSWIITDENGNKYYFGRTKAGTGNYMLRNQSSYFGQHGSSPAEISSTSWYLTEAYDMNEENSIQYTYTLSGNTFTTISGSFMPLNTAGQDCQGFNIIGDAGIVTTDATEYLISRIDGNSGYLIFNSVPDYAYGPNKMLAIQMYDPGGNYKGQYKFNYGTSFSSQRWKLVSFSQFGTSGFDSLTHKFEYNEFNNLPSVLSPGVDIWGFSNGQGNLNTGMIPKMIVSNGYGDVYWDFGAIRTAEAANSQANILKKITYPTGGYREIIYEGNTVLGLGDFFAYHPDPNYMVSRSFTETKFLHTGGNFPSMQHLFTVNSSYNLSKFFFSLNNMDITCSANYTVKVMRVLDSTDLTGGFLIQGFSGQPSGNSILKNGYYRVDVFVPDINCNIGSLSGNWQEGTYETGTISKPYGANAVFSRRSYNAGGVRIKTIRDYDPITGQFNKTDYKYKMYSIDSTVGSGLLISPVNVTAMQNDFSTACQYVKVYPGSSYPLALDGGSYVMYPEVRTIDSANGWTDRIYTYAYNTINQGFPLPPPSDYSYYRAKLLVEKVYDQNGALLKKSTNSWIWNNPQSQIGARAKPYWYVTIDFPPNGQLSYWTESAPSQSNCNDRFHDCIPDWALAVSFPTWQPVTVLSQSLDSTFASGTSTGIQTNYQYYLQHDIFFLKQKIIAVNNGQTREQTYKYAFNNNSDFVFSLNSAEQVMKDSLNNKNYLQPIEVVDSMKTNYANPVFISGAKFMFGYYNTSKLHLSRLRTFFAGGDSSEVNLSAYDTRGNLTEQYKTNDVKEAYLWGYNGCFPVAKIIGSNYTTLSGLVNLSVLDNPSSDAAMRTELAKISNALAGTSAQVTFYTYSPVFGGMTSMTTPEGKITYYEYDLFGRFQHVKDMNGKIIKRYVNTLTNPQ